MWKLFSRVNRETNNWNLNIRCSHKLLVPYHTVTFNVDTLVTLIFTIVIFNVNDKTKYHYLIFSCALNFLPCNFLVWTLPSTRTIPKNFRAPEKNRFMMKWVTTIEQPLFVVIEYWAQLQKKWWKPINQCLRNRPIKAPFSKQTKQYGLKKWAVAFRLWPFSHDQQSTLTEPTPSQ